MAKFRQGERPNHAWIYLFLTLIVFARKTVGTDCNAADNSNSGCGVQVNKANSYGPPFNSAGGGWYAMERTNQHINVYFWSRNDGSVPSDIKNGASTINTSNWVRSAPTPRISVRPDADNFTNLFFCQGTPVANFPSTNCNIASEFAPNNIVINLTFCKFPDCTSVYAVLTPGLFLGGDWAGAVYGSDGCPSDCTGS